MNKVNGTMSGRTPTDQFPKKDDYKIIQAMGRAIRSGYIIPQEGVWKFVRVDGFYRWLDGDNFHASHKDLAGLNEIAESAGMILIASQDWIWLSQYSMTLNIGIDDKDQDNITKLLRKPLRE